MLILTHFLRINLPCSLDSYRNPHHPLISIITHYLLHFSLCLLNISRRVESLPIWMSKYLKFSKMMNPQLWIVKNADVFLQCSAMLSLSSASASTAVAIFFKIDTKLCSRLSGDMTCGKYDIGIAFGLTACFFIAASSVCLCQLKVSSL